MNNVLDRFVTVRNDCSLSYLRQGGVVKSQPFKTHEVEPLRQLQPVNERIFFSVHNFFIERVAQAQAKFAPRGANLESF